ncbi:MAG: hypothetical protein GKR87_07460 [Kiritimatiellae bacterium]|nr:hypothetical protein [Kiritimatiellia bacterium]
MGVTLSLSGCVYLRLNTLKNQLAQFPEYFSVKQRKAPTLVYKNPVLYSDDMQWLTGLKPSSIQTTLRGTLQRYVFRKLNAPQKENKDIVSTLLFRDDKLSEVVFPKRFKNFITMKNFVEMFSPIKDARITKRSKKTEWKWREMYIKLPTIKKLSEYLGKPTRREEKPGRITLTYDYQLERSDGPHTYIPEFQMVFTFWEYNAKVKETEVNLGRLWMFIDVSKEEKLVKVKRN